MCLSTVYREKLSPDNIIMKNVQTIECKGSSIILTDLMDRQIVLKGELVKASLTEGFALVSENS